MIEPTKDEMALIRVLAVQDDALARLQLADVKKAFEDFPDDRDVRQAAEKSLWHFKTCEAQLTRISEYRSSFEAHMDQREVTSAYDRHFGVERWSAERLTELAKRLADDRLPA